MRVLPLLILLSAAVPATAGSDGAAPGLQRFAAETSLPSPGQATPSPADSPGTVASVIVHGNHTTPTADVLAIVGDVVGTAATDTLLADVRAKLESSNRFAGVDVRRRFLSLDDPTRVLLVIVVDERAGISETDLTPGAMKRVMAGGMWLPVLDYQEGYGFTYGARFSFVDVLGPRTRVSTPLTWGGERQAQVEIERAFTDRVVARVVGGGGITRRENPHFELGDTRQTAWGRVESAPRTWLRAGGGFRVSQVSFGTLDDEGLTTAGVDIALDTRRDPALPRNATFIVLGVERVGFNTRALTDPSTTVDVEGTSVGARRVSLDARGYLGLVRQVVLAVRARSITASRALPAFEQSLLGGMASLRGYDVGTQVGDNLAAVSTELLMPVTSPLSLARLGVKVFADAGTVYAAGASLGDQRVRWGYGVGGFVNATVFTLGLDVGWREGGGTPNMHVQFGVRLTR
jgi:outer membrane protein assembly factor BamA